MRFFKDTYYMLWRETKAFFRWKEWIIADLFGSLMWFLGFIIVWRAILAGGFTEFGGLTKENYIPFLLSGSLLAQLMFTAFGWGALNTFLHEKNMKTIQYLLISPMNKYSIAAGKIIIPIIRTGMINVVIVSIASAFFGFTFKGNLLLVFLVYFIAFIGFFALSLIIASLTLWREGLGDASWVLGEALTVFSGTMYPIQILPSGIREVSMMLPTTRSVLALRDILVFGKGFDGITDHIIYLSVFAIVSMALAVKTFKFVQKKAMLVGI